MRYLNPENHKTIQEEIKEKLREWAGMTGFCMKNSNCKVDAAHTYTHIHTCINICVRVCVYKQLRVKCLVIFELPYATAWNLRVVKNQLKPDAGRR